jgi:Uncharacterized protein conserved in bacteria C-term(DUF2220)
MSALARQALEKLLRRAENAAAKPATGRRLTLKFSSESFRPYVEVATHAEKSACHSELLLAQRDGAIAIEWERQAGQSGNVVGIELADASVLARFLEIEPRWQVVDRAETAFRDHQHRYSVLNEVISAWRRGVTIRNTTPSQIQDWLDAMAVIDHCRGSGVVDVPVRRISAMLMADSKRIESLSSVIDVLIQADLQAPSRDATDVFNEIGLIKFPPTLLISGDAVVRLGQEDERVNVVRPYLGFSPATISGVEVTPTCRTLLTVENLTTFHELACQNDRARNCILLYTGGMPSPSWTRVYQLLFNAIASGTRVFHWGDIDAGGYRIAAHLAQCAQRANVCLQLHLMHAIVDHSVRRTLSKLEISQIERICDAYGWLEQAKWIRTSQVAVEQESVEVSWP